MTPNYQYHVFISYKRSGDVGEWVRNHFQPVLAGRLESLLHEEPSIFFDQDIDVGTDWPRKLSDALHRSCCMVAVWTPSYFRSKWCLAEWTTILERERRTGVSAGGTRAGLVYPVVYSDGESFPVEAQAIQSRLDMHEFAYPYEQFRKSEKYLAFFDKMSGVAGDLRSRLGAVPTWDANWPSLAGAPSLVGQPLFARL